MATHESTREHEMCTCVTQQHIHIIAGVDLPERHGFANVVSKLPFTSRDLDPASLLERKQGLEKYIQVRYICRTVVCLLSECLCQLCQLSICNPFFSPSLPSFLPSFLPPPLPQLVSSRPEILESELFQEFLKSGVRLLREANSHNPHKARNRRSLLGLMKGHSDDVEEAKVC